MGIIGKSILAEQEKWYNRCNFFVRIPFGRWASLMIPDMIDN